MERKILFAPGEYYHIYNRGVEKRNIFTNLKDKEGFFIMAKGFPVAKVAFEYVKWVKVNEKLLESEDKPFSEEPMVLTEEVIKIEEVIKKDEEQSEPIKLIDCFKA